MTIIVGAGLAGLRLARALDRTWSRAGSHEPLVVFSEQGPFDRMGLGEWAAGRLPWPGSDPGTVRPETKWVARNVVTLQPNDQTLTDATGERWKWRRLILATGAEPWVPPAFRGHDGVFPIASVEGAAAIRQHLVDRCRVLIVGGGPLGLETAWNLRELGHKITLAHRGTRLLEPFLDAEGSEEVAKQWRLKGIDLRLPSQEHRVTGNDEKRVYFVNGEPWSGSLVILACGTRPRVQLAREAGLFVTDQGVVVDPSGQTSAPSIWAVGDCAVPQAGTMGGLWAPARRSVDRLLSAWNGDPPPSDAGDVPFRLKVGWPVVAWGSTDRNDPTQTVVRREGGLWKAVGEPGRLRFWQVLGPNESLEARIADLEEGRVSLTLDNSQPEEWPDTHGVCECHGLDAAAIRRAWKTAKDLESVGRLTGAGTSCGNCRSRILALKDGPLSRAERRSRAWRRERWGRWSLADVVGYSVDYAMLLSGLLTILTGLLKMPGWMEALGIDQRSLPDEANMVLSAFLDLHDWPGVILTVLALVHVALHWKMMVSFLASWFGRSSRKAPRPPHERSEV